MSTGNKTFVAAYVCLVGLPIIGLLAVLDAGHYLHAPIAIGGAWEVRADPPALASNDCGIVLSGPSQHVLTILQSGEYLTLSLADMQGDGRMSNSVISATELRPADDSSGANRDRSGYLRARLEGPAAHASLIGITGLNRSGCTAIPFHGTRLPPPEKPE